MAKPVKETQIQGSGEVISKIVCQIAAILVLSFALGLAFNASNPIGIAWSSTNHKIEPPSGRQTRASLSANTSPQAPVTGVSATNNVVSAPDQMTSSSGSRPDAYSVATIRPTDKQSQVIWSGTTGATTNPAAATTNGTNLAAQTLPVVRYA